MNDTDRFRIRLMGMNGFYAKTIIKKVRLTGGGHYSTGIIYKTLKEEGISLRAYREGWSDGARDRFKELELGPALSKPRKTKKKKR